MLLWKELQYLKLLLHLLVLVVHQLQTRQNSLYLKEVVHLHNQAKTLAMLHLKPNLNKILCRTSLKTLEIIPILAPSPTLKVRELI